MNMARLSGVVIVATLLVSSCAVPKHEALPGQRIDNVLVPKPTDGTWQTQTQNEHQVVYLRKGKEASHSIVALAERVFPPKTDFKNTDEYLDYVRPAIRDIYRGVGDVVTAFETLDARFGEYCVKYSARLRQTGRQLSSDASEMTVEYLGYMCRHPHDPAKIYQLEVSERHQPYSSPVVIKNGDAAFFRGIRFETSTNR